MRFQNLDNFAVIDELAGKPYAISICNTPSKGGRGERDLSYSQADVFILCFSTADWESFHNAKTQVNLYQFSRIFTAISYQQ